MAMTDFDSLISIICNPSSSLEARGNAERALLDVFSDVYQWRTCLPALYQANDSVCFFIGIGLQRLVWRNWSSLLAEDREALTSSMTAVLVNRSLPAFTTAKLEQVLAAICVMSLSLQPVLNLVHDSLSFAGLSAVRTVIEVSLSDDPKLSPTMVNTLKQICQSIVIPLTNLACSAVTQTPRSGNLASGLGSGNLALVGLDLLKIIITRLPLGPHITADVLGLLFVEASTGSGTSRDSGSGTTLAASVVGSGPGTGTAFIALELLTEILLKRYIPPGGGELHAIVSKVIHLLQAYRETDALDDALVLQLLELILVFADNHLERCTSPELLAQFLSELIALTVAANEDKVLAKCLSLWLHVTGTAMTKEHLLLQPALCINMASHILQCALQAVDELEMHLLVDPYVKEVLFKVTSRNRDANHTEDTAHSNNSSDETTAWIEDVVELMGELVGCVEVKQWLGNSIGNLLTARIQTLLTTSSTSSKECSELTLLMRVVALTSPPDQLLQQLAGFLVQLIESRTAFSTEVVRLIIHCTQIVGQLLSHCTDWETLFSLLTRGMHRLLLVPLAATSWAVLLLQATSLYAEGVVGYRSGPGSGSLLDHLGIWLSGSGCSLEVFVLLTCTQDQLSSTAVAPGLAADCQETLRLLELGPSAGGYEHLVNTLACMDALVRSYSISKAPRRAALVAAFASLPLTRLTSCTLTNHPTARLVIGLTAGLLQCLGKKTFGRPAAEVLEIAVTYAASSQLYDTPEGLVLVDQMLELAKVLAESTAASSPGVGGQIAATYRLLGCIIPYLSNERVCSELLAPVCPSYALCCLC